MKNNSLIVKLCLFAVCIAFLLSLTGCISESFSFTFSHSPDEVRFMRIYYTTDSFSAPKDLLNQDPVCEISPEEYSKIMEKIEGCSFDFSMLLIANAPSPSFDYSGYILYVEYLDGESSVLDNRTRQNLDAEGLVIAPDRYCLYGYSEEFNNLLEELAGNDVP